MPAPVGAAATAVRFDGSEGRPKTLDADLMVDASSRGEPTLALLDTFGWHRPEVTEVGVDFSYATVLIKCTHDARRDWKLVLTMADPPTLARHGVLIPVEGDHWTVTLADHGPGAPIGSWQDFLDASRGLATRTVYNALRHADPPDHIRHYGFRASQWRHIERLPRLPRGVLPIADALCRFNPIYGQGMSSAGKQGRLLLDVLNQSAAEAASISTIQDRFMAQVAGVLETPWTMSTSADLAFPGTRGHRPDNFEAVQQSQTALFRAAVVDPVVHRCLIDVAQLLQPDSALQQEDIQRRIEEALLLPMTS